jgi:hypothetical protein
MKFATNVLQPLIPCAPLLKSTHNPRSGIGVQPSLSKARHWAQRALEAAPDAKKKAEAAKMLAEVQGFQAQYSDSAWAAALQVQFDSLQGSSIGEGLVVGEETGPFCSCLRDGLFENSTGQRDR